MDLVPLVVPCVNCCAACLLRHLPCLTPVDYAFVNPAAFATLLALQAGFSFVTVYPGLGLDRCCVRCAPGFLPRAYVTVT